MEFRLIDENGNFIKEILLNHDDMILKMIPMN